MASPFQNYMNELQSRLKKVLVKPKVEELTANVQAHLYDLAQDAKDKGASDDDAEQISVSRFGSAALLAKNVAVQTKKCSAPGIWTALKVTCLTGIIAVLGFTLISFSTSVYQVPGQILFWIALPFLIGYVLSALMLRKINWWITYIGALAALVIIVVQWQKDKTPIAIIDGRTICAMWYVDPGAKPAVKNIDDQFKRIENDFKFHHSWWGAEAAGIAFPDLLHDNRPLAAISSKLAYGPPTLDQFKTFVAGSTNFKNRASTMPLGKEMSYRDARSAWMHDMPSFMNTATSLVHWGLPPQTSPHKMYLGEFIRFRLPCAIVLAIGFFGLELIPTILGMLITQAWAFREVAIQ